MRGRHSLTDKDRVTYFLLEEACTIWIHSEAGDAWSSQVPGMLKINLANKSCTS